ncbi:hypothetical protein RhiirA5_474014 [Rhizophagus irregularis]|uniref:Uncharacterized protein n=3 Tax=Rhizophagus irregularis TaxID=588596 RepID=U9V699_RHIID|nr:hypothetical protein GLOIN_2v1503721 [Rhizophagus irregularis DAOM 181602=DAOM 197198]EXX56601.1 hypothetical protein RirG_214680 [Rhizophagus irregularis DAOM 197198w]PKC09484.1 hypothetical protein RhiirA5_474014 [Rhizophagus irregularis]PKY21741.1 hypothetical protein RhiirB3_501255 [Rhizophagus irregularis]POG81931.1 hypothetical protein GLOIN_2v1503721 [Rhizophagus irregularis DAOM 181602=DAOM 197198]UZO27353.1 hypothetical protein OCT59_019551 [Rhizophagus irregularis]|eukprot:XP_025188797.1 hypothetical protein GLOIN_2v1503721 [Rhizophagus irregularis DAOM 181602=DAOM 197198]
MKFSYFRQKDIRDISNEDDSRDTRLVFSSGRYKFSTKRYHILESDNFIDANKVEYKFVKDDIKEDKYYIRKVENSKKDFMFVDLGGFTTYKILGGCINQITARFLEIFKANLLNVMFKTPDDTVEIFKFRLNIYFGRELFSNIEKESFTPNEWIKHRREPEKNMPSFHHYAPQFLKKLLKLQGEFKFQLEEKEDYEITKGKVHIYFNHGLKRRMAKLKYSEEDSLWKLTELRDTNTLVNLDLISGTEEPDFRFSMRIRCETYKSPIISKIENIVNEAHTKNSKPKNGLWLQAKYFEGVLENVEISQTITKKRFINENYKISVHTLKKESKGELSDQETICLESLNWRDIEDENKLGYGDIYNTISKPIHYVRGMMNELKKIR